MAVNRFLICSSKSMCSLINFTRPASINSPSVYNWSMDKAKKAWGKHVGAAEIKPRSLMEKAAPVKQQSPTETESQQSRIKSQESTAALPLY